MSEAQPKFLIRAKETHKYHRSKRLLEPKWNVSLTAKALRRSIGSISEDLTIARWAKTHEKKIEKFKYAYEAIEWIKKIQYEQDLTEIE